MVSVLLFFFFSSRRRHTRYWRDWSSDVCSSDLYPASTYPSLSPAGPYPPPAGTPQYAFPTGSTTFAGVYGSGNANTRTGARSEEGRVGKEGRSRGAPYHLKKKKKKKEKVRTYMR